MDQDGSAVFFGMILGAIMGALLCGLVLIATGNFARNLTQVALDSPAISALFANARI